MPQHLFFAGVPCTGKSLLGEWLAKNHGYLHIDTEIYGGSDFDRAGIHAEWNDLIATKQATNFLRAVSLLKKPIVIDWGFPTGFLYVVAALQAEGVEAWWFHGERTQARAAFVARGGIDPECFDRQMDDIEREWQRIALVFGKHVLAGLHANGIQRQPEELWSEINKAS
ncbi:MAG: hypothetical protein HY651_04325 [Acidobacteria bacterium]|nr:hypothetical protein [Acidobacteriota bacterium]